MRTTGMLAALALLPAAPASAQESAYRAAAHHSEAAAAPATLGPVTDYPLAWPGTPQGSCPTRTAGPGPAHGGSTHEIAFAPGRDGALWVSGQNWHALAKVDGAGKAEFVPMPPGSGPHGLAFDKAGTLWVTLEYCGLVREIDLKSGRHRDHDVRLHCRHCAAPIDTHPHGLAVGPDQRTIWFTGKATGTVGRILPDGRVAHFALKTAGATPIYIHAGPDGAMWATELTGNAIARIDGKGGVTEFPIPTPNSRPIAVVPGPERHAELRKAMWFTEEAGNKVGRIDLACAAAPPPDKGPAACVSEIAVPRAQPNMILAALAFDRDGDLWVQQYVDQNNPAPAGPDYLVRIDKAALTGDAPSPSAFTFFRAPTQATVMHRIIAGPDGEMWFTEMHADRVGKVRVPK